MIGIKNQRYGTEIEMTGITREEAAKALANYFGTTATWIGGGYDSWTVTDAEGRNWKLMSDSSIHAQKKIGYKRYADTSDRHYKVEMVTPILEYKDMETLQEAVRQLRHAGATVNPSCGMHIHIDGANHTARSLKNILSIMFQKEDLLFKALQVNPNRVGYCKKTREDILTKIRKQKNLTTEKIGEIWYGEKEWHYRAHQHYDDSRYHTLNLHAFFGKGTVEFRLFNSTLHAGEVKANINLALAISAQAINQRGCQMHKTESTNEKFTFRTWLLRLGLNGDEFATTRQHLLKHLDGDSAWRYTPEHYPTHPATLAAAAAI